MAAYLYNCSSSLRQYAKYNERHLAPLKVALIKTKSVYTQRIGEKLREQQLDSVSAPRITVFTTRSLINVKPKAAF